jgi:hypothetical protein
MEPFATHGQRLLFLCLLGSELRNLWSLLTSVEAGSYANLRHADSLFCFEALQRLKSDYFNRATSGFFRPTLLPNDPKSNTISSSLCRDEGLKLKDNKTIGLSDGGR